MRKEFLEQLTKIFEEPGSQYFTYKYRTDSDKNRQSKIDKAKTVTQKKNVATKQQKDRETLKNQQKEDRKSQRMSQHQDIRKSGS